MCTITIDMYIFIAYEYTWCACVFVKDDTKLCYNAAIGMIVDKAWVCFNIFIDYSEKFSSLCAIWSQTN